MKKLQPDEGIRLFDIRLKATTAGPSPFNNERTEVFLLGCDKAAKGSPCPGCFNSITWNKDKAEWSRDPIELAAEINKYAPNKYVTIGGGEPTDQFTNLFTLCKELKETYGFHIMMYTWRDIAEELNPPKVILDVDLKEYDPYGYKLSNDYHLHRLMPARLKALMKYVDIIVDGEFNPKERLYQDDCSDGFFGSIGSGNQKIWDCHNWFTFEYMRDLKGIELDKSNNLIFIKKEKEKDV